MRRSPFVSLLLMLSLLSACGRPQASASATTPTGQQAYSTRVAAANGGQPTATASSTPAAAPSPSTAPTASPTPTHPAAASPTPTHPATASPTAEQHPQQAIAIDFPKANATISSPLTVSGRTNFWPFEATL